MKTRKDNWNGMNWIRQEKRLAIYLRDGMACVYCGATVEDGTQMSLDHVRAHSHGGTNDASNLVTACSKCNSSRGNRSMPKFAATVAAYLDNDKTADSIVRFIRNTTRRTLPMAEAKRLMNRRNN